jgi:hypothetical protein
MKTEIPAELSPPSDCVLTFPGRPAETLTLALAKAETEEGRAKLREFCRKKREEGAAHISANARRRAS